MNDATKTEDRLSIRASANQKATLRRAADARHMNVSQFVLQASLSEAERVIDQETILRLSAEQYQWLAELMDAPVPPMKRLRTALEQNPIWDV